jgi:hypothetical protein
MDIVDPWQRLDGQQDSAVEYYKLVYQEPEFVHMRSALLKKLQVTMLNAGQG